MIETTVNRKKTTSADGLRDSDLARHRLRSDDYPEKLRIRCFESTSSFLLALMVLIACGVTVLLVNYLMLEGDAAEHRPLLVEVISGNRMATDVTATEFEAPDNVETGAFIAPTANETIRAIADSAGTLAASLDESQANNALTAGGASNVDNRIAGPGDGNVEIVPRHQRWQLEFSASGLKEYAKQLDHFGIELGLLGDPVEYAFELSSNPKRRIQSHGVEDSRMYFVFLGSSPLQRYDLQLLTQAKIHVDGRPHVKLISKELENQLATIELEYAKSKSQMDVSNIIKTVFASTQNRDGYEFKVISQRYRR